MAKSEKRPKAVFKKPEKIGDFILKVRLIIADILANSGFFTTPSPPAAAATTNVNNLEAAQTLAQTRVVGSAAARDIQYNIVLKDANGYLNYVQTLADNAPDQVTAIAIIQAAGFEVRLNGVRVKAPFAVKNGDVSG